MSLKGEKANGKITDQDYIGEFECDLAEIITSTETLKKQLYRIDKKEKVPLKSFIFIHSEQMKSNSSKVNFKFAAQNLEKKRFWIIWWPIRSLFEIITKDYR